MKNGWRLLFLLNIILISCSFNNNLKNGDFVSKIDSLDISYSIKGKGPVMFVGHPNSGKIGYELTLQPLEKHFTTVYYNSRGTGNSEAPKNISDYRPEKNVEEIELLRKKIGVEKIWLFGHSDQSGIALEYALKYPKNTEGLILIGTSFVGDIEESVARRKVSEQKRMAESAWFSQIIKDWDYMIEHKTNVGKNGRDLSEAPMKWWMYDEESYRKVLPFILKISEAGRRKPVNGNFYTETPEEREKYLKIQKRFNEIKAKTFIINGKYDTNNPPEFAEKLHQNLPNSEIVIVDKSGHFPWIENSSVFFEALDSWLKKN